MVNIICPLLDGDVSGFKCGNDSIESQIENSYAATLLKIAFGHKIILNNQIVGYYMNHFKTIEVDVVNSIMGDEFDPNISNHYTAMHILYLAIEESMQNQGIGTIVLKGIISEILLLSKKYPIRIITIDALDKYYDWYKKVGFKDIPGKAYNGIVHPMYLDCISKSENESIMNYFA